VFRSTVVESGESHADRPRGKAKVINVTPEPAPPGPPARRDPAGEKAQADPAADGAGDEPERHDDE
jgi:hypothetical protein